MLPVVGGMDHGPGRGYARRAHVVAGGDLQRRVYLAEPPPEDLLEPCLVHGTTGYEAISPIPEPQSSGFRSVAAGSPGTAPGR